MNLFQLHEATVRRHVVIMVLLLFTISCLAACSPADETSSTLHFTPCRLPQLSTEVQCTRLDVPQRRELPKKNAKTARTLSLHIARLPANTVHPDADPLILLAGGPGQAASALVPFAAALADIRRTRDILLIDQRGTGRSSPLKCDALDEKDDSLSGTIATDLSPKVAQCLEQLTLQSIDPLDYGTLVFVEDIEAVRQAMYLTRFNLWAGSYGTRVALEYLRRYPQYVRTLTLDGVVAPATRVTLDAWRSREARLNALLQSCEASDTCRMLKPAPEEALDLLASRLAAPGRNIVFTDPRTGNVETLRLDFDTLFSALQPLLYSPDTTALLPQILNAALNDDYAPLLTLTLAFSSNLDGQLTPALYYAITCGEDVPRISADERAALQSTRSHALAAKSFAACAPWPAATLPADWGTPVNNDTVPVLLLSGALDPVTPPAYADGVARTLKHHRAITANGGGHIVSTHGCAPQLITTFVKTARFEEFPVTCIDALKKNAPPLLWSNRLAPSP